MSQVCDDNILTNLLPLSVVLFMYHTIYLTFYPNCKFPIAVYMYVCLFKSIPKAGSVHVNSAVFLKYSPRFSVSLQVVGGVV